MVTSRVTISRQILREYVSAITRPQVWATPVPLAKAVAATRQYIGAFNLLEDGPLVWNEFERLSRSVLFGGKQVHDANLVATMLAHGETQLLTFNGAHFRRFSTMINIIEP